MAVICGLSSLVVTKENEYTLIMRFGKLTVLKQRTGLSFKVPFLGQRTDTFLRKFFCMIWQRRMSSQRIRKTMIARQLCIMADQ